MPGAELERIAREIFGGDRVSSDESLDVAIRRAVTQSRNPLSDETFGVLITGSVVTVGEARAIVREISGGAK